MFEDPAEPEPASTDAGEWREDEEDKKPRPKDRRMKRRSRSKLLRPFKEFKRLDPFNRRLLDEQEMEGIADALSEVADGK